MVVIIMCMVEFRNEKLFITLKRMTDMKKKQVSAETHLFLSFMKMVIAQQKQLGKARTAETYTSAMNSFRRFLTSQTTGIIADKEVDISMVRIDSGTILAYEMFLKSSGLSLNSISFYMRNLRAVYNRAAERNLTQQRFPFKRVYTGVDKTIKRAIPLKVIRRIKEMDLTMSPTLDFARDMFLFSFYTRGMSFIDMAYLRKRALQSGILSYRRRKTGQQLQIKWEKCMDDITRKYYTADSVYLLPIIAPHSTIEERRQYIYMGHNINRALKVIGERLGLKAPLTMYVARHAWASIAWSKNIPLSVISEGMGHNSEKTTRIYLASLNTVAVDKANSIILKSL